MKILSNNTEIVKYNASGTHAFIQLNIQEGPKIYIKDIVLKGNQFTKDYVLLIEADLEIGELITPKLLSETTNRLNRLGLFSRVDITTLEANTSVEGRTLVISVIEDEPGTFRFGLGASSEKELTLRGFTGISFNNLDGTGRGISLRAELKNHIRTENEFSYKVTLGYLEPFLFNSRTRGRVNLTRLKDVGVIDTSGLPITESNRLDFLLERDLTNDLTLTYTLWSLDSAKKYLTRDDPDTGEDVKNIVVIGPTFTYEKRNSLTNPTRGYLARWSLKYSNPNLGSSDLIHFYQTEASFVHLTPLSKTERWVWSNSIRGGYVENLSDKAGSGVPDSYAFFLGGFSTVRGFDSFESDERIPPKYELPTSSNNQLIISTNSNYHLFKSEVRFPLYNKWGGVLFYDAGTVIIAGSDQRKPFRQSAGFGLYYDTPFGPVNLQVGYKLDRQEPFIVDGRRVDESPYKFHFSIGVF